MIKLDLEAQLKYGAIAKEYSSVNNVSFRDACAIIIDKYNLPIKPKTLSNNTSSFLNRPVSRDVGEIISHKDSIIKELEKEIKKKEKRDIKFTDKDHYISYLIDKATSNLDRIKPFNPQTGTTKSKSYNKYEVAMLDISDVHLGKMIDPRDTAGICYYDNNVFEKQCKLLIEAVGEIIDIQRGGGIDVRNLYINMLGDIVDGELIYGGHQNEIHSGTFDQIYLLGEYFLKYVLLPLSAHFESINIIAVNGNHGRVGRRKEGYDKKLNFDNVIVRMWESRLKHLNTRYTFNISDSPYLIYTLLGKTHLISHKSCGGTSRLPMGGMERYLSNMGTLNRQIIDYLHLAHIHRDMKFNFNFSEIITNGSWIGPTEFSVGELGVGDYAFQRFYGLNHNHITWTYPIYLDEHIMCGNNDGFNGSEEFTVITPTAKVFDEIVLPPPKF